MSFARILNKRTLLACAAIGTLIAGATFGQQMLDGQSVLAATTADQLAPVAKMARQIAHAPSSLPQKPDCDDFAFAFLHSTCSKPHVKRHVARNHRVATTVISRVEAAPPSLKPQAAVAADGHGATEAQNAQTASLSPTTQPHPIVKKPRIVKNTAPPTSFGGWFGQQGQQRTAMRSFFE